MYGDKRSGICMEARQKHRSRHLDYLLTRDRDRVVHEGWMVSQSGNRGRSLSHSRLRS